MLISLVVLVCYFGACHAQQEKYALDVTHYNLTITPEISKGYVQGEVSIHFSINPKAREIKLNADNLSIKSVTGAYVDTFSKNGNDLLIGLSERNDTENVVTIAYEGNPKRGLLFNSDRGEAYTVYFTSEWMVCNDQTDDRASLALNILVPKGKTCVASGELTGKEERDHETLFKWNQHYMTPPYTYGFAIGDFDEVTDHVGEVKLNYYTSTLDGKTLKKVFEETGAILQFFEEKSGVKYVQNSYSQILMGNHYQEMSGLSVLRTSYAAAVLKDSSEIHLTSHELAHQWWGNMITCKSLKHFWLNEAFAVYMASAFNEHRFGVAKYDSDIALYKGIYDDLLKRGKDKPLIFSKWIPSRDNRNVVYYKGAYVLHLLREEIGQEAFWKGIKSYSQQYFGKSVETLDFQKSMEASAGRSLDQFFDQWVYASKN
ncbi:MAG: M1 family metallopeptidase [Bacteroidota bacterium]